jgi:lysophospholipase L1-like esterase
MNCIFSLSYRKSATPNLHIFLYLIVVGFPLSDKSLFLVTLMRGRSQIAQKEGRSAPMYIKFDSVHLDKDGNKVIAEELFNLVRPAEKGQ